MAGQWSMWKELLSLVEVLLGRCSYHKKHHNWHFFWLITLVMGPGTNCHRGEALFLACSEGSLFLFNSGGTSVLKQIRSPCMEGFSIVCMASIVYDNFFKSFRISCSSCWYRFWLVPFGFVTSSSFCSSDGPASSSPYLVLTGVSLHLKRSDSPNHFFILVMGLTINSQTKDLGQIWDRSVIILNTSTWEKNTNIHSQHVAFKEFIRETGRMPRA